MVRLLCFFQGKFCELPSLSSCDCQNGGICVGDQCLCPAGYVGDQCEKVDPCSGECVIHRNDYCNVHKIWVT